MEQIQTLLSKKVENINISATLDTRHLTPETEKIPVIIRVNCNRRHYYYPTGYKFTLKEYDKLCKSTGKGASNKTAIWETKKELLAIFEKVEKAIKDLSDSGLFNFENLKTRLTGRSSETFLDIWRGIISDCKYGLKVLANGSLTKKVTVKAASFSEGAKTKIEEAGGKAEVV